MDISWLMGGGLIAAFAAGFQYLRILWSKFYSFFITTAILERTGSEAMLMYLNSAFKVTRLGSYRYVGVAMRTQKSWRNQLVLWEVISNLGAIFWRGWRPIWVTWNMDKKDNDYEMTVYPTVLTMSFIRGTYQRESLLVEAQNYWNEFNRTTTNEDRYFVERVVGQNARAAMAAGKGGDYDPYRRSRGGIGPDDAYSINTFRAARPIGIDRSQVGHHAALLGIKHMALDEVVARAVDEARRWSTARDWYRERGLPWKLGWLLYGSPGQGKTTLARAISEELHLPIYIYDLASLANDELISAWGEMRTHTPCVALFEDIDAVFHGRENVANEELTFDCLLNCMDGVEQTDGVFVIVTTNNVEQVDPALGRATPEGGSTRPGRLGRILEMKPPNEAGRYIIARRILMDCPEVVDEVVALGANDSGDQFQARCFEFAQSKGVLALWVPMQKSLASPATATDFASGLN